MYNLRKKNDCLIEYYLPFLLLLSQYKFGPISLGEIGLMLLVLIKLSRDGFLLVRSKNNSLTLLMLYVMTRMLMNAFFQKTGYQVVLHNILQYSFMWFATVYLTNKEFDEDKLYKSWKIAGVIFSAGLVYQLVLLFVVGRGVKPIPIIPGYVLRGDEVSSRPSSFFAEPAAFVCAMLPLVFMALKRQDFSWAVVATLASVASTSTVGIILTAVLWVQTFFQGEQKIGKRVAYLLVAGVGLWTIVNLSVFSSSLGKLSDVINGDSTVGARILCGLDTVRTMNLFEWIFGTAYNDSSSYIYEHLYRIPLTSPVHRYMNAKGAIFMNTLCMVIFHYGLVGLWLYWEAVYSRLAKKGYEAKPYLIMMLVSILGQGKFLNSVFFMELILILLYGTKK